MWFRLLNLTILYLLNLIVIAAFSFGNLYYQLFIISAVITLYTHLTICISKFTGNDFYEFLVGIFFIAVLPIILIAMLFNTQASTLNVGFINIVENGALSLAGTLFLFSYLLIFFAMGKSSKAISKIVFRNCNGKY